MSVRPVQIPFSHIVRILPEKRQVHDNVTWSPVRDSSDVSVVTAAACRHTVFAHPAVKYYGLVPYGRDVCDEISTFLLPDVVGRGVAEHVER